TTQKNLELVESIHKESASPTLLQILDKTVTPMGARLLKQWLVQPLARYEAIIERQISIEALLKISLPLEGIRDLERLTMRITSAFSSPRDLIALKNILQALPALKKALEPLKAQLLQKSNEDIGDFSQLTTLLLDALLDDCPSKIGEAPLFKTGYAPELDALYALSLGCKDWLLDYQNRLRLETGIKSLKVAYTNAFGYFIDVSSSQKSRVPDSFQKRQTLVSSERFITEELKNFEQKALSSEEQILRLETKLLEKLRSQAAAYAESLFQAARAIAIIDCLQSMAFVAHSYGYVKPIISIDYALSIEDGRHPVIEQMLTGFIPNSTELNENQKLMVLTGPNMGGKSTYIRQVALITLMAHLGSFVPAKKAIIPLVDKIFTRIGASDDLSRGQSTFMVEMTETAHILHMATSASLVILDEIGRGTSTFDGISIAWSVAEYLLQEKRVKTLFATHYFELTDLPHKSPKAFNAHVAVQESRGSLIFLHRILEGPASRSFGIQVAELAGLPSFVITRAKEIQKELQEIKLKPSAKKPKPLLYQAELPLFDKV
ncbi:MAG: DNA mismatch repair protein MutS, partial [Chlamydiota bacterium]